MHDRDNIKFITHLLGNDSSAIFYIQDVFLFFVPFAEFKHKMPFNRTRAWDFFSSYHLALIVSEKIKRREIKGVVINNYSLKSRWIVGEYLPSREAAR